MMPGQSRFYTGNEYLEKNPGYHLEDSRWKAELIMQMIRRNKLLPGTIADIGCGAGGVLKEMAKALNTGISFTGYDISRNAIELANIALPENIIFHCGNYFDLSCGKDDLILVIDLLEHLDDYYSFLRGLRKTCGHCIFHIPLDLSSRLVLKHHILKQQRDNVGHVHYFTLDMVWWFLQDAGFRILDWQFTKPVSDVSPSPTFFRGFKKRLRNVSFAINADLSAKLWGDCSVLILAK